MRFIIPIFVGAIIGYITNWLAIKMLFRPLHEKKFLGIHIPFTPGLIPKEMNRIARSVGETVGVHLLSPKIVTEALSGDKINAQVQTWIESNINRLKQSDKSINELLKNLFHEKYNKVLSITEEKLTTFICSQLKEKRFKDGIMNLIQTKAFDTYRDDLYKRIREKAELFLYGLSTSEEVKAELKNIIFNKINELANDQRTLGEVIPDSTTNVVKKYIDDHREDIANVLREMIQKPSIKIRLKKSIALIVSQNVSKMVTMFMSPETISEKMFKAIENSFDSPETDKNIAFVISASIDKLLQGRISSIVSGISSSIGDQEVLQISDFILGYVSDKENQSKAIDIAEEKIKSSEPDIEESLLSLASNKLDTVLNSQELYETIYSVVHDIVQVNISKPISYVFKDIDEAAISSIVNFFEKFFNSFAKNKLPYIVELLDIPKIVEDQINSFDVAFAEEIIVEIANKELKAITWLGALLGGIMGILSPLLQLLD